MFDVQQLFHEKYPSFVTKHPWLTRVLVACIRHLWREAECQRFIQDKANVQGVELIKAGFDYLDFDLCLANGSTLDAIPENGGFIVVANHPIGSLDGLGLLKLISAKRPGIKSLSNAMLYTVPHMRGMIFPIDNVARKLSKKTYSNLNRHLADGNGLLIFPAGLVSRKRAGRIDDLPWRKGFYQLAKTHNVPIIPMYIDAHNSWFFYSLSRINFALSTLWLVREMFNFRHQRVPVYVGQPMDAHESLMADGVQTVRHAVYALAPNCRKSV